MAVTFESMRRDLETPSALTPEIIEDALRYIKDRHQPTEAEEVKPTPFYYPTSPPFRSMSAYREQTEGGSGDGDWTVHTGWCMFKCRYETILAHPTLSLGTAETCMTEEVLPAVTEEEARQNHAEVVEMVRAGA